jgi:hypothetical protein
MFYLLFPFPSLHPFYLLSPLFLLSLALIYFFRTTTSLILESLNCMKVLVEVSPVPLTHPLTRLHLLILALAIALTLALMLIQIGLKSVLTTLDAINVVALHLSTQSEPVGLVVLDILREILDVSHLGIRYVASQKTILIYPIIT